MPGRDRPVCARARPMRLRPQQRLMVAALTCNQTPLYNHFVIQYRGALRRSDADLAHYFKHHGGMAGYHAYKTKLANSASLESLKGVRSYCANSASLFHSALDSGKVSLVMLAEQAAPESAMACGAKTTRVAERGKTDDPLHD